MGVRCGDVWSGTISVPKRRKTVVEDDQTTGSALSRAHPYGVEPEGAMPP